jgi:hypothetical protein
LKAAHCPVSIWQRALVAVSKMMLSIIASNITGSV